MELPDNQHQFYRLIREAAEIERAELVNVVYLGGRTWSARFSNGAAYRLKVMGSAMTCNRVKKGI